jgi:hypothetical protein
MVVVPMRFPADTIISIYESEGRAIEIDWPESSILPIKGRAYTVQSSRRAGKIRIVVLHAIEDGLRAEVMIASAVEMPTYLGKSGGYTTKPSHAMSTYRPGSDSGPVPIVAEGEPESLTRSEASDMARRTRYQRIEGNRLKLSDLYEALSDLRNDPNFSKHESDVKFMESLAHKLEAEIAKDDARHLADLQEAS